MKKFSFKRTVAMFMAAVMTVNMLPSLGLNVHAEESKICTHHVHSSEVCSYAEAVDEVLHALNKLESIRKPAIGLCHFRK